MDCEASTYFASVPTVISVSYHFGAGLSGVISHQAGSQRKGRLLARLGLCVGLCTASLPSNSFAQQPIVEVSGGPSCKECQLSRTSVAVLGDPRDDISIEPITIVVRDTRGWFYVAGIGEPGKIGVFDPRGRIQRRVGRLGSGPGEFRSVTALAIGEGNTLHVFGAAHHMFDTAGAFIRSRALPIAFQVRSAVAVADGELLLQGSIRTPDRVGYPFHLWTNRGLSSFGRPIDPYVHNAYDSERRITRAGSSTFWSSQVTRYVLELWSKGEQRQRVLERKVPWFAPWSPTDGSDRPSGSPPRPTVGAISVDSVTDQMWVLLRVPMQGQASTAPTRPDGPATFARQVDAIIEVIDLRTNQVLVSQRVPSVFNGFVAPGMLAELRQGDDGEVAVHVWQYRVVTR